MKVREGLAVVIVIVMVALAFFAGESTSRTVTTTVTVPSVTSESSLTSTSFDNTFTWHFPFTISVNYGGSWRLVYWGENGTATQNNVEGSLSGSGNYETTMTLSGVGYIERTLCANATKLDSQNLILTLTVAVKSNSTTASNPSAEVCFTVAP